MWQQQWHPAYLGLAVEGRVLNQRVKEEEKVVLDVVRPHVDRLVLLLDVLAQSLCNLKQGKPA